MSVFDSTFVQGYSHLVCEDYSIHNVDGDRTSMAVLSDGCSSANFTDIGSRILCIQAVQKKHQFPFLSGELYGELVLGAAPIILQLMGFRDNQPIFATMGIVAEIDQDAVKGLQTQKGNIRGLLYGDGAFIFKLNEEIVLIKVDYDGNMPYYPAYNINPTHEESYALATEKFSDKNHSKTITKYVLRADGKLEQSMSYRADFHSILSIRVEKQSDIKDARLLFEEGGSFLIEIPKDSAISPLSFLFVASDGIFSFVEEKGIEGQLDEDQILALVLKEIGKIQPTAGGFIQRRVRKMKEFLKKQHKLDHYDDLSIAGLML